jgi:transposase
VAMDMSAAYRGAVSTHLKRAVIVFDHFHIIKLFNDKLSDWTSPRMAGAELTVIRLARSRQGTDSPATSDAGPGCRTPR